MQSVIGDAWKANGNGMEAPLWMVIRWFENDVNIANVCIFVEYHLIWNWEMGKKQINIFCLFLEN